MSKITNDGLTRMLYSCSHVATGGVKGITLHRTGRDNRGRISVFYL